MAKKNDHTPAKDNFTEAFELAGDQLDAVAGGEEEKGAAMGVCPTCGKTMSYLGMVNGAVKWHCYVCNHTIIQ